LSQSLAALDLAPDILINNAGMVTVSETQIPQGGIEMSASEWHNALNNNLTTAFFTTRIVMPFMRNWLSIARRSAGRGFGSHGPQWHRC